MPNTVQPTLSSRLSPELTFLIACCRAEPSQDDADLIRSYLPHITDHRALLAASLRHGVLPLVYKAVKKLSDEGRVAAAEELTEAFKTVYMQIAQRNMLMTAELLRLMKLLEKNGIDALAFKGPALAQLAYGDITLRQFGDLDILVGKTQARRAISLLEADGYVPEIQLSGSRKEAFFASVNVIGLSKPSHGIRIEVHWELLSKNYAVFWDMGDLWSRPGHVTVGGSRVPVPSQTDHLLYLCIHGSKHVYERLEWITDIDRSVRMSPPDWERLLGEAEKKGVKRMVLLGLWLCRELLSLPLPEAILTRMDRDKTAGKLGRKIIAMQFGHAETRGRRYGTFGLLWCMREKFSDRLRFTLYGLLLPKFDDFRYLALPRPLIFLYPVVRLFRLTTKYFKR